MTNTLAVGTIVEFQIGSFLNTGEIMKVNPQSYRIEVRNVFGAKSVHTVRFEKIYRVIDMPDAA